MSTARVDMAPNMLSSRTGTCHPAAESEMNMAINHAEAGDQQLDDNQFLDARESFRRAVLDGIDSDRVIHNLHVAEKEERDAFWRSVVDKFPNNRKLRMARLEWRLSGGFAQLALLECTELLRSAESAREMILLKLVRLRAASRCCHFDKFADDFRAIWSNELPDSDSNALRRALVSVIAELTSTDAIPALEDLIRGFSSEEEFSKLLSAKRLELLAIDQLTSRK